MKKRHLFILAALGTAIEFLFTGCAHQPVPSSAPSSAIIDNSLTNAIGSVSHASRSLSRAQSNAATIYQTFTNAVTNTVLRQDFLDMESDLADTQDQLSKTAASLTTTTNALVWYEQDSKDTHAIADSQALTIKKLDSSVSWWRSKALWAWGLIAAVLIGIAIYFGGPWLGKIFGAVIKTP